MSQGTTAPPTSHRIARTVCAAALPGAFLVFVLHITGAAFAAPRGFGETVCWCMAGGAAGSPTYIGALRRVAGSLGVAAVGWVFLGAAVFFSVLDLADSSLHPAPGTRLAALMLLLSVSVPMVRNAQYLAARERAEIVHRLRLAGLEQQLADQRATHEKEIAQLRGEFADAVQRARTEHREGCVLAERQRTVHVADLADALSALPEQYRDALALGAASDGAQRGKGPCPVVPLHAKANGSGGHN